jgi:2-oxo-4-hydroxy-4-carboxy-5-ureidoimidazoline decarboxylase
MQALIECCSSPAWVAKVAAGWPYASLAELLAASDSALAELTEAQVDEAVGGHARIGQPAAGSAWSRAEQSGAAAAPASVQQALAEGNAAYERRFGRVFLICASGLTGAQMLTALQNRLTNDAATELAVVREELRKITRLRLTKLVQA